MAGKHKKVDFNGRLYYNKLCRQKYSCAECKILPNLETVILRSCNERGGKKMSEVRVGENESLESALRRFKRKCARAGVLAEIRKREHYEKPSVKRKKKAEAARKRKH